MKSNKIKANLTKVIAICAIFIASALIFQTYLTDQVFANPQQEVRNALGTIEKPDWIEEYDVASGSSNGLIFFVSRMIRLITVIAGLWVLVNMILIAYTFLTKSGSADTYSKAASSAYMSVLGLVLIITAYTMAGLVGLILYGDATYILNPVF